MSTDNECSAVARLGAESLWQTKDGLRKKCQNPSRSWLQHSKSRAGARGRPTQNNAKPPPREWNAPSSNKERDSHAGTRSKQRYERWDGPRGRQRSPGRHWEKTWDQSRPHESHWERSWNQPSSFGNSRGKNSWESNGNSKGRRQTHPGATSPRNRRKNS